MEVFTTAKYANYIHIYMYIVNSVFAANLERRKLTDENYQFNVSIDGNVATWSLDTTSKDVVDCFADTINNLHINDRLIKKALGQIEKKNHFSSEIKDLDLLTRELSDIKFIDKKPKITNDSLESPAIDFKK